jgi:hypothetical protein
MKRTPFFPAWRARLAPAGSRLAPALNTLRSFTLSKLEDHFAGALPASLFLKATSKENSRDRLYTQQRTFWCFLWQCLTPQTSCRQVVRQVQALFTLWAGPWVSQEDGAYCRARLRLPAALLPQALAATARAVQRRAPSGDFLQARPVRVMDGSSVTMPDSPANQKAYPKVQSTYDGGGFPMLRLVVLFCLTSGAIVSMLSGNLLTSELCLLHQMLAQFKAGDIALGDRGFGNYVVVGLLRALQVDFIGRSARRVDGRRRQRRLGRNDWLVRWRRSPNASAVLSPKQWDQLPKELTVRIVRGSLWQPGFRVRQVTLVTTLLDPALYPAEQILRAYARRWRLEMCLDDLKTTLGMEMLRCQSPAMVQKEVYLHLIAHNLIRLLLAQAASVHPVSRERMSFKGALDALRQFSQALCQARSRSKRGQLWDELLRTLAADLLPERPGRREPRAVKRQKNKYPRLDRPRDKFRDHPKRHVRRQRSRLRNASLK